jgi:hypothetical protein
MVGVNKLAQAIERVGFVACQFALWVVLEEWFNSEQEPNFGEQVIVVCFLFAVTFWWELFWIYLALCNGHRKMYNT